MYGLFVSDDMFDNYGNIFHSFLLYISHIYTTDINTTDLINASSNM